VKRVEGKGVYAIKMVGSMRGKFRIVGWKSLLKDGSFNKCVTRGDGPRVRDKAIEAKVKSTDGTVGERESGAGRLTQAIVKRAEETYQTE
jgi:hypothetical protein